MNPMTAETLNSNFAEIIDQMELLIARFAELRDAASDEAWDQASTDKPFADTLCDIEYEVETMRA